MKTHTLRSLSRVSRPAICALVVALCFCFSAPAGAQSVFVFAASSLSGPVGELKAQFVKQHPGVFIQTNYAASSTLATQISNGAKADLFLSADIENAQRVANAQMSSSPLRLARNRLVAIASKRSASKFRSWVDIAVPARGVRVAGASDGVPIAKYTRELITKLKSVKPDAWQKYSAAIVSKELNVRALMAKVALGEVDAGFVYISDLKTPLGSNVVAFMIPELSNVDVGLYGVALKAGSGRRMAAEFLTFLTSAKAGPVWKRHGFVPVR